MLDYKSWVERAAEFTRKVGRFEGEAFDEVKAEISIAPPLTETEIQQLKAETERFLPAELLRFWSTASRHCHCRYFLDGEVYFYGGASFLDVEELPARLADCLEWAESSSEDPIEEKYWQDALPFIALDNGDYVGLDISEEHDNPPVIYLAHDDASCRLAPSFTSFLETWERLCYLGPEIWMLEDFQNEDGLLNADTEQAQELRAFFSDGVWKQTKIALTGEEIEEECLSQMEQITTAAVMYWYDHDEILPDARTWCDVLGARDKSFHRLLKCPAVDFPCAYAMNENLSGVKCSDIKEPERTVLFFESNQGVLNAHDTGESLPELGRHNRRNIITFADSRTQMIDAEMLRTVKWTVE